MNYEKKYKEALERAREQYNKRTPLYDIESIFPELKESKDERIKKAIIRILKGEMRYVSKEDTDRYITWLEKQGSSNTFEVPETSIKDAEEVTSRMQHIEDDMKPIAEFIINYANWNLHKDEWNQPTLTVPLFRVLDALIQRGKPYGECVQNIEKQGENKPTYKVEPKFKVGDFIVNDYCSGKVIEITNDAYLLDTGQGIPFSCGNTHLWTIADAKGGDVLVNGSNIFIFHFLNGTRLMGYCHINIDNGRFYDDIGKNECFCLIDAIVNPATKEQRDLLFQKMKEVGYEWDSEKKELKKIEPKKLDADKVIAWLVANICDFEYYVKLFKKDFEL